MYVFFFLVELCCLFGSSYFAIQVLYRIFFLISKSTKASAYMLSFLFFPGSLVHELAHVFMAMILGVRIGKIDLFPKINGEEVRLGSVEVYKSDSFRRFFIGIAPLFVGMLGIYGALEYVENRYIIYYLLFIIANNMFSSKFDMEGVMPLLVTVIFFTLVVFGIGVQIPSEVWQKLNMMSESGTRLLMVPLALNLGVVVLGKVFTYRYQSRSS